MISSAFSKKYGQNDISIRLKIKKTLQKYTDMNQLIVRKNIYKGLKAILCNSVFFS